MREERCHVAAIDLDLMLKVLDLNLVRMSRMKLRWSFSASRGQHFVLRHVRGWDGIGKNMYFHALSPIAPSMRDLMQFIMGRREMLA